MHAAMRRVARRGKVGLPVRRLLSLLVISLGHFPVNARPRTPRARNLKHRINVHGSWRVRAAI